MEEVDVDELVAGAAGGERSAGGGATGATRRHRQERKARHGGGCARRGAHHLAAKFRSCRKRPHNFNTTAKFFLPHKRPRKDAFIPPTKFLLGGNISDPLNLNSLQDEDVNRAMNAVTPESSPLPTPPRHKSKVDVIIPPDVHDPLNLLHPVSDDEYEKRLERPQRIRRPPKRRPKPRRRTSESTDAAQASPPHTELAVPPPTPTPPASEPAPRLGKRSASESDAGPSSVKSKESKKPRRMDSMDKIVSPVVPQPGAWMRARPVRALPPSAPHPLPGSLPNFHPKNERYQYGNYDRYYGYRNSAAAPDVRLEVLQQYRHLFLNKDVLDVGCNVGFMSIAAARELGARTVTGIDIDHGLIGRARKSLQAYVSVPSEQPTASARAQAFEAGTDPCGACSSGDPPPLGGGKKGKRRKKNRKAPQQGKFYFPASFSTLYGPIETPGVVACTDSAEPRPFPHNVVFKQGNYIVKDEALLTAESAQYDLVLCLSTTKWLHLNFGDAGLKLAFRRMFSELRPGGKLVLEPQSWPSYGRKKRLTEQIYNNYNSIELFPDKFREYLLSPEVGFSRCCVMGVPRHRSKGFRRPLHLYIKGDFTPSKAQWSDAYAPPSSHHRPDAPAPRRTVYAAAPSPAPLSPATPRTPSCDAAALYSPAPHLSPFYAPSAAYSHEPDRARDSPYASPAASAASSPAAPFLEPSPGHSHAYTPTHSASAAQCAAHKYAPTRSPQ